MSLAWLKKSLAKARRRYNFHEHKLHVAQKRGDTVEVNRQTPQVIKLRALVKHREWQISQKTPLRERAYQVALTLVGVMEHGGNNMGTMVTKIIRANGGAGPEPWCGDGQAYCYRLAGSKAVTRAWAQVSAYLGIGGIKRTSNPLRGMLVRFTFDHIGMFICWCDEHGHQVAKSVATHIKTFECNTGASGAVSDSATGGDGAYIKIRSRTLVRDFLSVSR